MRRPQSDSKGHEIKRAEFKVGSKSAASLKKYWILLMRRIPDKMNDICTEGSERAKNHTHESRIVFLFHIAAMVVVNDCAFNLLDGYQRRGCDIDK